MRRTPGVGSLWGTALLVLGVALLGPAGPALAGEGRLLGREGAGFLQEIDGQLVLHVAGTPREMGLQHGRLLAERVRQNVQAYLHDFALGHMGHTREELRALWLKHRPFIPDAYIEEMTALAEGAGVPVEDILLTHVIPTRYHCSGAAAFGEATADGELYHFRSLDYALQIGERTTVQENACLIVRSPADGVAHVVVGWAGIVGCVTGMNDAGIAIGQMGSATEDMDEANGTPMVIHLLEVLRQARGLDDAVLMFERWERGEGYSFIVSDGGIPDARVIEVTRSKIAVFRPNDPNEEVAPHAPMRDVVRRSNHFVSPELAATQREPYDPTGYEEPSLWLYETISRYLAERHGALDADAMRGLGRIYPDDASCLHQAVFRPRDGAFWVATAAAPGGGRPAGAQNQPFHAYNLKALLATDPDDLEAVEEQEVAEPTGALEGHARHAPVALGDADDALRADLRAFCAPDGAPEAFRWRMEPVAAAGEKPAIFDLTFPSARPSPFPENNTVYGRFYQADGLAPGERAPLAIVLHHLGGDFSIQAALAEFLALSGVHAIDMTLPYYGPRRPPGGEQRSVLHPEIGPAVEATRQAVADVRRALDWALTRPDVDPDRVGVTGVSLGGIMGAISAGVDDRLQRNVLVIAGGDLAAILLHESRETRRVRAAVAEAGLGLDDVRALIRPVEPLRFAHRARTAGILMLNAEQDEIIPRRCTEALWEALGQPEIVWFPSGHVTVAVFVLDLFARTRDHYLRPASQP